MRPRDQRPSAWHQHKLVAAQRHWRTLPGPAVDALVLGCLSMGALFRSGIASAGLAAAAFAATQLELDRRAKLEPEYLCTVEGCRERVPKEGQLCGNHYLDSLR